MPANKTMRYALFGLLYFTQGTILSYFTSLNALYFLSKGMDMASVGIFGTIAMIPFILKIFLGMLSDKYNLFGMGHRKPYILIGLAVQFLCLLVVPFVDPKSSYWGFVLLAFILQMGMALYDTCTDGLALDTTPKEERGIIQGVMVGGRAVGVIVVASLVGLLAEQASWMAVFWLLAGLTLLPLPIVLRLKDTVKAGRRFEWSAFSSFKRIDVLAVGIFGLVAFMVIVGANQLVNPYMENLFAISFSTAGQLTSVWGIGVVLGGLVGGRIVDRLGRLPALLIGLVISSLSLVAMAVFATPQSGLGFAFILVGLFGLAYGTYQAVYFAVAMGYTDPRIAASMFAILMAFTNIGQAIGLGMGGSLSKSSGYPNTFLILAGLNVLGLILLPFFARRKAAN
jgi:PAT family beta-lactamase induction signal transducer AmpG